MLLKSELCNFALCWGLCGFLEVGCSDLSCAPGVLFEHNVVFEVSK